MAEENKFCAGCKRAASHLLEVVVHQQPGVCGADTPRRGRAVAYLCGGCLTKPGSLAEAFRVGEAKRRAAFRERMGSDYSVKEAMACALAKQLCVDAETKGAIRSPDLDCERFFGFRVTRSDDVVAEVLLPGLPPEKVRFTAAPGQRPRDFCQVVVDGSSWLWDAAVRMVRCETGEGD